MQQSRPDKDGGLVRLFIFSQDGRDKGKAEAAVAARMAELTGDVDWTRREARQTLILEHHMAATRLGFADLFGPLYAVDGYRTGLLDGNLPGLRFFVEEVLPFVRASREGKPFEAMAVLRHCSPLLAAEALKQAGKQQESHIAAVREHAKDLLGLWGEGKEPLIESVLNTIGRSGLFEIPESLLPLVEDSSVSGADGQDDPEDAEDIGAVTIAWREAVKVPFSQNIAELYRAFRWSSFSKGHCHIREQRN